MSETTDRWQQIKEAFSAATRAAPEHQGAVLAATCGDDSELLAEVEGLLEADARDHGVLPGADGGIRRLGPYDLGRRLGSGGTSEVFLACRRDDPARRPVAVKVMRGLPEDDELTARFFQERQILGGLDHPNVAALLDGGTTDEGLPYVVLEYVEGRPIDAYCRRQGLSVEERLDLFLQVCAAVQHAHRNLVVHRDLKPANVLVTPAGQVKLLDFGVAKLLNAGLAGGRLTGGQLTTTLPFFRRLTLRYASPEQVLGDPVTTASDVYSLGVLLFELLAEVPPYCLEGLDRRQAEEAICSRPVPAPSSRAPDPRRARRLEGDLDSIVLQALRKEPGRRYGSAAELGEDVARHLQHRPVKAVGSAWTYRTAKLVRRNPLAALLLVALLVFAAGMAGLAGSASRALEEARRLEREAAGERAKAERVSQFLVDLFESADPRREGGQGVTARQLLDRGARRATSDLQTDPRLRAAVLDTLGRVYRNLGAYGEAEQTLGEALTLRRVLYGGDHREVAASLSHLAALRYAQSEFKAAEELSREALELRRSSLESRPLEVAESEHQVAEVSHTLGRLEEAEARYRRALEIRREAVGDEHPVVVEATSDLAYLLFDQGRFGEARALLVEALEVGRPLFSGPHPVIAHTLSYLGAVERALGDLPAAEEAARESLALFEELVGPEHPDFAATLGDLGLILVGAGRYEEAESHLRRALALQERMLAEDHPLVATHLNDLALALRNLGRLDEAEPLYERALGIARHRFGDDHSAVATIRENLADVHRLQGDREHALAGYRQVLEVKRRVLPAGHVDVAYALLRVGLVLTELGRGAAAEPHLREAVGLLRGAFEVGDWRIALAQSALGGCLLEQGRLEEAAASLVPSTALLEEQLGPEDSSSRRAAAWLARLEERRKGEAAPAGS